MRSYAKNKKNAHARIVFFKSLDLINVSFDIDDRQFENKKKKVRTVLAKHLCIRHVYEKRVKGTSIHHANASRVWSVT